MKAQIFNLNKWIDITDSNILYNYYSKILKQSGFNILKYISYNFKPFGYTGLFLLSESHLAIHTFSEEEKTYIELSSCIEEYFTFQVI